MEYKAGDFIDYVTTQDKIVQQRTGIVDQVCKIGEEDEIFGYYTTEYIFVQPFNILGYTDMDTLIGPSLEKLVNL